MPATLANLSRLNGGSQPNRRINVLNKTSKTKNTTELMTQRGADGRARGQVGSGEQSKLHETRIH